MRIDGPDCGIALDPVKPMYGQEILCIASLRHAESTPRLARTCPSTCQILSSARDNQGI